MPRQARLDAPGTVHHVILRGLDRGQIVADAQDRAAFVARLGDLAAATGTTLYAWALLPNHAHLLLRSGPQGLPQFMRRVLTGYALAYNRRHQRAGHLFQNRYKSIGVEEEPYFRELVRYIHLNPLRARLVPDLPHLDRYPWSGHAGILGRTSHPWQDRAYVLSWFGRTARGALRAYCAFLREGLPQGRRSRPSARSLSAASGRLSCRPDGRVSRSQCIFGQPQRETQGQAVIHIIRSRANKQQITGMLQTLERYIKLAVDIRRGILAGGGAMHADCEAVLLEDGSQQEDVWGMEIIDSAIRQRVAEIAHQLLGGA